MIVVALPVGLALLVAELLLIAIAARDGAAGDGGAAEGGACLWREEGGVARLLQPVEEAHCDAGTRRGAGMSVAHGCREKRITGRAEEKDG